MKQRLIALVVLLALLVSPSVPVAAHTTGTMLSGHNKVCEGWFGFDHAIVYDGNGWYHNMTRYINVEGYYTVIKKHFTRLSGGGYYLRHTTSYSHCSEGPVEVF